MLNDYLSRFSFRRRIIYGYLILFFLTCSLLLISLIQIGKIVSETQTLYEHPFNVIRKITEIDAKLHKKHALINQFILIANNNEINNYIIALNENEKAINQDYDTVFRYSLGDKSLVVRAKKNFSEWRVIRDRIVELKDSGRIEEAASIARSTEVKKINEITEHNNIIRNLALERAKDLIDKVNAEEKISFIVNTSIALIILVLGSVILLFVERSVTLPIRQFTKKAKELLKLELKETSGEVTEQELLDLTLAEVKKHQDELERLVDERTSELIVTIDKLELSNKELEQFAYVASHDLQEPLRMISSFTQLLERRYKDKLDKDAIEFIRFAVDGANRMQKLINDLLEFSRISVQGDQFTRVDTQEILGNVISNLHQLITSSTAIISNEDLPVVNGSGSQFLQLFQNLIENAIKFRNTSEIPIIHISCEEKEDVYEFSFRDNGIGIDMQFHDRVFVIFQRLHSKEKYSGTGIGLPICKRIVERHGGKIWFESIINEGTTFKFTVNK